MATYPVKWYASQMQGAPSLGDTTEGALTALLKAVLVTGFGNLTVNAIAWDATEGAAKATISGGHSYLQDSVIEVSGATPTGYNGEHRVKKVSTTEVWFELDGGNPGIPASGTLSMKVAPLGWTLAFESADQKVAIYRPTDVSASGNVLLRIDNTAWTNWNLNVQHVAKVQLVEDVVDINTYTLIGEYLWPCTGRYSDKRWDLVGDPQLFYYMPAYASNNRQSGYAFGYLKSVRPGDRYHAILYTYFTNTPSNASQAQWTYTGNTFYGNMFAAFEDSNYRVIARPYHQLFGATSWWIKGLFGRFGNGLNIPNGPDNGYYISTDPIMVIEAGNHLRGYLPGLVVPFATITGWNRKNFSNLPAVPNKILRFIQLTYNTDTYMSNYPSTLVGFDLTGPWR